MIVYVAFLRGINVGGRNIIRMKDICEKLESDAYQNVSSYRASGNILFMSNENPNRITETIREQLHNLTGREIGLFLRSYSEIEEMVESEPFKGRETESAKLYVTMTHRDIAFSYDTPFKSPHEDVEVFLYKDGTAYSQAYERKGRYGSPNKLLEFTFKIPATTRNWNTIKGLLEVIKRNYL